MKKTPQTGSASRRSKAARTQTGKTAKNDHAGQTAPRTDKDRVGEASDESFPASDPPAWTSTSASRNGASNDD